jgi:minor extracellular serine protease Vpr
LGENLKYIFILLLVTVSILQLGCQKNSRLTEFFNSLEEHVGIISHRPQTKKNFIAVVKLKNPALLEKAQWDESKNLIVDAELKKAIDLEQAEVEKELQKLSSQIQIIFRYKMVLNGFAIVAPIELQEKLKSYLQISYLESNGIFTRPEVFTSSTEKVLNFEQTSVKWIGALSYHEKNIKGQNLKVGIIDTGIDFTHQMLGGDGNIETFKNMNPSNPTELFPNKKVVGGIDLAGTDYDTSSGDFNRHVPKPDINPMDEGGHGTHVAGTVAGQGDGVNTYDGVAPEAQLYAIKVFGKEGSTGDATVIAALEYAADPSGKGTGEGRLDVVNMSLGSPYGTPHVLYSEAIRNLVVGGRVFVVASAGNSGPRDFIVGSPSINDQAFSVAASVDNMDHNWKFDAVRFLTSSNEELLAEAIQGSLSKPISEIENIFGELFYIGLADKDLSLEQKESLRGKVALIDRGVVAFSEKIKRAFEAGAVGVVVVNNQASAPIPMGGEGNWDIPAIMITQTLGQKIKKAMNDGMVQVYFKTDKKIEKPELIDTITGFSSKGPRSYDGFFKPEISAPGSNIISADMGKGREAVKMSGTSMAAPHVAGVVALLKQAHPDLSDNELKSLMMGKAKIIKNDKGEYYPLSLQGAGRIQINLDTKLEIVSSTPALSLGIINLESKKRIKSNIQIKNISKQAKKLKIEFQGSSGISMKGPSEVTVSSTGELNLPIFFELDESKLKAAFQELEGFLKISSDEVELLRIPMLALVKKISNISADQLLIRATSVMDSTGASTELSLKNNGIHVGEVQLFNHLGSDQRKMDPTQNKLLSRECDLQSVGYRIVEKESEKLLQVAVKLYEPLTSWNSCEVTVLIDKDGDQIADQELAGFALENVKGLSSGSNDAQFYSTLLDAKKVRDLRLQFEKQSQDFSDKKSDKKPTENYKSAVIDQRPMTTYDYSTVVILEANINQLATKPSGELSIKVATLFNEASAVEGDDYLTDWMPLTINPISQSYLDLPEKVILLPGESKTLDFVKGEGNEKLLIYYPQNKTVRSEIIEDQQSQILNPIFALP